MEDIVSSIHPDLLLAFDERRRIFYCSGTVSTLLGYEEEDVLQQPVDRFIRIDELTERPDDQGCHDSEKKLPVPGHFHTGYATGRRKSGETVPLEFIGGRLNLLEGEVMLLRDISERRRREEEVQILTEDLQETNAKLNVLIKTDPLTRTLNRRGFEEFLNLEIYRSRREGSPLCVMIIDCDDLKDINDLMGHGVGDIVLQQVAKTLEQTLRETDHIARIGGDEYLVLMPNTRIAEATVVAERVRIAVQRHPLTLAEQVIPVTISVGLSPVPRKICSTEEVLALTAIPLKRSKLRGKNTISCSEQSESLSDSTESDPTELMKELLHGDCFRVFAQQIVRLEDRKCVGYELLIRTNLPPLEGPHALFQFATENNILNLVDQRCLEACFSSLRNMDPTLRWHVNLFPSTLLTIPFAQIVQQLVPRETLGSICMELSEQQFIGDPAYLKESIVSLKDMGLSVAIDDLGFGRSSLESLVLLEPDIVKIDIHYVRGIGKDPGKRRALIRMKTLSDSLEAEQIAEGIETEEDLEVLKSMGIVYGQGFLFQRPTPITEISGLPSPGEGDT